MATFVTEFDLIDTYCETIDAGGHSEALVLIRRCRKPLGSVRVAVKDGKLKGDDIREAVAASQLPGWQVTREALHDFLIQDAPRQATFHTSWTIVVCTRDHVDDLRRCLDSLIRITTPDGEIIVVDNAPSDDKTVTLVKEYPARYVREDRPGLNWARSRGARAATGEIVLYTDDDAVVDAGWVEAMLRPFAEPRVAAVTGMTMPLELETPSQEVFEQYGGHGRGFQQREFDWTIMPPAASGNVGAGVNMAIRRELLNEMRLFDYEMDAGTVTRTGGDNYAFYLLLAAGYKIVYTPDALVWHRHRRTYDHLCKTLKGYSVGAMAALTRCFFEHGDWQALSVILQWIRRDHLRKLKASLRRRPDALPPRLVLDYIAGLPIGPWACFMARRRERQLRAASKTNVAPGVAR